ncbi:hypothetical protein V1512DRAFT_129074 [Lipomyces arxii]|uniref:uncharacterized protein n=1 Tax=Lipomyces arxii TaxID=56418 RepID=UPI0034CDDEB7
MVKKGKNKGSSRDESPSDELPSRPSKFSNTLNRSYNNPDFILSGNLYIYYLKEISARPPSYFLSSFAAVKGGKHGIINNRDISPEELRYYAYQAREANETETYNAIADAATKDMKDLFSFIDNNMTKALRFIELASQKPESEVLEFLPKNEVHNGHTIGVLAIKYLQGDSSVFDQLKQQLLSNSMASTQSNQFGSQMNSFGSRLTNQNQTQTQSAFGSGSKTNSAFGSNANQTSAFGQRNTEPSTNTGSAFGTAVPPPPPSSSFTSATNTSAFGTSAFGSNSQQPTPLPSGSAFGARMNSQPSLSKGFGSLDSSVQPPPGSTNSTFGSSNFGSRPAPTFGASSFGSGPAQSIGTVQSSSGFSAFANKPSPFGALAQNQSSNASPFAASAGVSPSANPSPFASVDMAQGGNASPFASVGSQQVNTSPFATVGAQTNASPFASVGAQTSASPLSSFAAQTNASPFAAVRQQSNASPFSQLNANASPFAAKSQQQLQQTSAFTSPSPSTRRAEATTFANSNNNDKSQAGTNNNQSPFSPSPFGQQNGSSPFGNAQSNQTLSAFSAFGAQNKQSVFNTQSPKSQANNPPTSVFGSTALSPNRLAFSNAAPSIEQQASPPPVPTPMTDTTPSTSSQSTSQSSAGQKSAYTPIDNRFKISYKPNTDFPNLPPRPRNLVERMYQHFTDTGRMPVTENTKSSRSQLKAFVQSDGVTYLPNISDLTLEEKTAFEAKSFELGKVPEIIPPLDLM